MSLPELSFGPFVFDPHGRLLRRDGTEVPLPPRVLGVLELLLSRAGAIVPRQELIDTVWKEAFVTDTSLAEAVSFLRQALGDDPQSPRYIQTVHRRGYRFVAPVTRLEQGPVGAPPKGQPTPQPPADVVKPSIANELLPWSVAILCFAAALSAIWYATRHDQAVPPIVRIGISLPDKTTFDRRTQAVAISPLGDRVAWVACTAGECQLYVRDIDQLQERRVSDTDGAAAPFFSPDGTSVGFFAGGKLKRASLKGGAAVSIADASQPYGAVWMSDGRIIFAASVSGGLLRVRENGGAVEQFTLPSASQGELRHAFPVATTDGEAILFTVVTSPLEGAAGRLAILRYRGTPKPQWHTLAEGAHVAGMPARDLVAFAREGELHAIPYDPLRQAARDGGQVVETSVVSPHVAMSSSGALIAVERRDQTPPGGAPAWIWTAGSPPVATQLPGLRQATLSPDGRRLAGAGLGSQPDVWVADLDRGTQTRLTHATPSNSPAWTRDGRDVLYATARGGPYEIWVRAASGSGDQRRVLARPDRHVFPSSTSDAGVLAYVESGGATRADIGVLPLGGTSGGSLIVQTPFDETAPAISPDGTLIAYQTDESGRWEVVLLRRSDGRRTAVSTGGGTAPFWSADGAVLFYQRDDTLMTVRVAAGEMENSATASFELRGAAIAGVNRAGSMLLHQDPARTAPLDRGFIALEWARQVRRALGPPSVTLPR